MFVKSPDEGLWDYNPLCLSGHSLPGVLGLIMIHKIPESHPRLLFTAEELRNLREQAKQGLRAQLLQRLDQACTSFITPGHPHYLDFRERQRDTWRARSGIFTVLSTLNAIATAYAFTGKQVFGEFARDAVMAIIEHGLADVKGLSYGNPYEGWRHGPGHDKGKFAQCLSWVYDTCFDRFSPDQRRRFASYAAECIKLAMIKEHRAFDQAQIANNRGVAGLMVPAFFALVLEGDAGVADVEAEMATAVIQLEKYLFLGFDGDGAPYEGPGYAGRITFVAFLAEAIRRRGGPNLLTHSRFERFPQYLLYELLPGGGSAHNLNDANLLSGSVAACLHLMGTEEGALLPWLAQQLDLHPERTAKWLTGELCEPGDFDLGGFLPFLLYWKDDLPVRSPQELGYPLSHCFPTRGVASLRSGWEGNSFFVSHFCGRQELYCHRQGDFNHVSFYALGEAFLIDAGYGHGWSDASQPVDRWFGLSSAHNCVLIDGGNQRGVVGSPGWAEGQMLEFQRHAAFDASLGDASSCTGPDHRVRRALRRVVLVRDQPVTFLVILDVNEKDGAPFIAEALWTTHPQNRVTLGAAGFSFEGRKHCCEALVAWPQDAAIRMADSMGRPQVRVSVRAAVSEMVTIFCPRLAAEPMPEFSLTRESEGCFTLTCKLGARASKLHLTAVLSGPLRQPAAVSLEANPKQIIA